MNINLFANSTTFGVPYSSPPDNFTVGEGFGEKLYARSRFIKWIPVPEKAAYFANPIIPRAFAGGGNLFGDLDFEGTLRWVDTEMIHLNPALRFMPAEIFRRSEPIPLESLASRNVAVVASDNKYQMLGEVGEQNRRQSFYHSNTPMHPELYDECIAELAKLGFFRMHEGYALFGLAAQPVFNINFKDVSDMRFQCFDLANSSGQLPEYKHLINHDLLQWPIIEIGQVAQAAYVSSVYSPVNKNRLLLIRHADSKLPMLQGTELIETKYQAMIDRAANAGQATSIENEGLAKSLREAEFFMAPYQKAIRFCQSVIGELSPYSQDQYPSLFVTNDSVDTAFSHLAIRELEARQQEKYATLSVAIDKAISRLTFSEQYMISLSSLVRQAMVYDELMQLENTNPMEDLKIKQEENRKQLIHKEIEWHNKAVQQEILPRKSSDFPMINMHSLIMTSLCDLLVAGDYDSWGENALRDKIADWKTAAQTICAQTDEQLSNLKTMHSLKLMSVELSFGDTDAADDIENH